MRANRLRSRVLLDVDGIIADFHTPVIKLLKVLGAEIPENAFTQWDIFDCLPDGRYWRSQTHPFIAAPGFVKDEIQPYDGALEGVSNIMEIADVYFCTSPYNTPTWANERLQWIAKYFFNGRYSEAKRRVMSGESKFLVAGDFLVDDKPEHVEKWSEDNPDGIGLLWDTSFNREIGQNLVRAYSWAQLKRFVETRNLDLRGVT